MAKHPAKFAIAVEGDVAFITVGTGEIAKIDAADVANVAQHRWSRRFRPHGEPELYSTSAKLSLSRFLMNPQGEQLVDHKDGDPLNNRRSNLRLCTILENNRNMRKSRRNIGFKGVRRYHARSWGAYGTVDRKQKHIGMFADPISAARAYDDFARKHFGAFACLNYPLEGERPAMTAEQIKLVELELHEGGNAQ